MTAERRTACPRITCSPLGGGGGRGCTPVFAREVPLVLAGVPHSIQQDLGQDQGVPPGQDPGQDWAGT